MHVSTYRSLSAEVGCRRAEVFREIRRCLRLSGGVVHQGVKWIWKAAAELAALLGANEKTIRGDLAYLVKLGWLKREKLQRAWGWQVYHYTLGDRAPLPGGPDESGTQARTDAGVRPGSVNSRSTVQKIHHQRGTANRPTASRQPQQPGTGNGPAGAVRPASAAPGTLPGQIPAPSHWPAAATAQQTRLAIENLRNAIPLLRRAGRPAAGFAAN